MSIVVHEVAHGYVADRLGDKTARYAGRLTLNPLPHIDFFGSIVVPAVLILSQSGFLIGWAKPVPFNPHNTSNPKKSGAIIALAGPAVNISIAIIFSIFLRLMPYVAPATEMTSDIASVFITIVITNLVLAIFNLVPIPPLDGHHVLYAILPDRFNTLKYYLSKYSLVLLMAFILFGWEYISPLFVVVFKIFTGLQL